MKVESKYSKINLLVNITIVLILCLELLDWYNHIKYGNISIDNSSIVCIDGVEFIKSVDRHDIYKLQQVLDTGGNGIACKVKG